MIHTTVAHAVTRPSFGAASAAVPPGAAGAGNAGGAAGGENAGDIIGSLLADEDVKKALDGFRKRITEGDAEAASKTDGKPPEKKTFFQTIKPWLSLLGTLAVAVLGVIFGKRGGVIARP